MSLGGRAPYYSYRAAASVARAMPAPMALASARALGLAFAQGMRGRRSAVARTLQRVRGEELHGVALQRAVQQSFDSYARYWMEMFRLPSWSRDEIETSLTYEGFEYVV